MATKVLFYRYKRQLMAAVLPSLQMLDLYAAFDTIDHSTLLNKLSVNFGISGTAITWLSSYLTDRFQSVLKDGNCSSDFNLMYGVPRGSVLGPVLFTMYLLPLGKILKSHNVNYHINYYCTQTVFLHYYYFTIENSKLF